MKVLHLLSTPRWSGAAEPVLLLCRQLVRQGHEIHLAFSSPRVRKGFPSGRTEEASPPEGQLKLQQKAEEMQLSLVPELRLNVYANLLDNLHDCRLLRRLLREGNYSILHCHLSHALNLGALSRLRLPWNGRLIYTHHAAKPLRRDPWHRWLVTRQTDHILTYSPEVAQAYRERFKFPETRLTLLRGGVDWAAYAPNMDGTKLRERWGIPPGCLLVGMVARMRKQRDHATLLRAIARLAESPQRLRCVLVGHGEHLEAVRSLADDLGLADRVVFAGYLESDYLQGLAAMDIFAYTASGSDASCRAVIEAMALRKPVVGVRRAALPLLVEPDQTGFLFEPGDDEQLAQHIRSFLSHPSLAKRFGEQGRLKVEKELTIEHVARTVEQVYQEKNAEREMDHTSQV